MSQRNNAVFAVACIGIAVMTRIIAKKYFKNPPSNDIPMPNESDFAIGEFLNTFTVFHFSTWYNHIFLSYCTKTSNFIKIKG